MHNYFNVYESKVYMLGACIRQLIYTTVYTIYCTYTVYTIHYTVLSTHDTVNSTYYDISIFRLLKRDMSVFYKNQNDVLNGKLKDNVLPSKT